jgi:GNAT superfamily N-acetyltransferase
MSIYNDPRLRQRVYELLDIVWPGDSEKIRLASAVGAHWHEVSTPFVRFDGDRAIAHAGVLEIPLVIDGQTVTVAGVHAVCTHPDYRRRGYSRQVMEEALAYCDARFKTAILTTDEPTLYTRYGFRVVPEHRFEAEAPRVQRSKSGFRKLSDASPADVALLRRLLRTRAPVSNVLGVLEAGEVLIINEILSRRRFERIHYAEDLDLVAVYEVTGRTLHLYDLVAADIPSLEALIARVEADLDRVEIHFTPDRLRAGNVPARARPPGDYLMVRGPFAVEGRPFILPPLARC